MLGSALVSDIHELIEKREYAILRDALSDFAPADVAEILTEIPPADSAVVFRILPKAFATDIFENLAIETQEALIQALGREDMAAIINEMAPDDRTALLEELPPNVTERLLNLLSREEREIARTLLNFPENSVGRLMTTEYVRVKPNWTLGEALEHLRKFGRNKETIENVYVSDEKGFLVDDIRLREIVLADPGMKIADLMDERVTCLRTTDDQEEAVRQFKKYGRHVMPVVDSQGILVGIVTVDDVLTVAQEEAAEDLQRVGGLEALETSYLKASILELVRKRAMWLIVLFIGGALTATVIEHFQGSLERFVVLALFLPLIISSGGNSGSQATTLIIRALATGELTTADWRRVLARELATGVLLGLILATVGFLRIFIWGTLSPGIYGDHLMHVARTVALALIGVVLWGSVVGAMFPLLLKRVGFDPAMSSAPFVATLVDVTGLLIYFTAANVVLGDLVAATSP